MRRLSTPVLLLAMGSVCVGFGCSKTAPPQAPPPPAPPQAHAADDPSFDRAWTSLAKKGVDTYYIEDDRGEGLMGNVLRAQGGALAMAPDLQASLRQPGGQALPLSPSPDEVQKLIRQNLGGVKSCYLRVTRDGEPRSGKAIVSFQIGASGHVEELRIDAPAFSGTSLPTCVTGQISHWIFPPSQKGGLAISYPFVFVGS
jgi:hypothetical protein